MAWSKRVEKLLCEVAEEHEVSRQRILHTKSPMDVMAYYARGDLWYRLTQTPLPWGRKEGASLHQIGHWFGYSTEAVRQTILAWRQEVA